MNCDEVMPTKMPTPLRASPKIQMRLVATDEQGLGLEEVILNQDFYLRGYVTDLRSDAKGVFAYFMDVEFDNKLVQVIGEIEHSNPYINGNSGSIDVPGVIDEVGGLAGLQELGATERLVFTVPMRATAAGTVVFDGNPENHEKLKPWKMDDR